MAHNWRFIRYGGFDQVYLDRVEDFEHLGELDQKLWAALACPTRGLEFDRRTLDYIDADKDGRIRVPELLAAVRWALDQLKDRSVLVSGESLPLLAINSGSEEGRKLVAGAGELLSRLGKPEATCLTTADTEDLSKVFPPAMPNGDGLVPAALAATQAQSDAIADIIRCTGQETDRSGEPGVSEHLIRQFFADLAIVSGWRASVVEEPLGDRNPAAFAALSAVEAKIDDFFTRSQLAGFDNRALPAMNGSEEEFAQLGGLQLSLGSEELAQLPLARVAADSALPLIHGINPAWRERIAAFKATVVDPLLAQDAQWLDPALWLQIKARFQPYREWLAARPAVPQIDLPAERLTELNDPGLMDELLALVASDLAVADAANSLVDLDKLVRYQRHLRVLLNNFVSLTDFYTRRDKAVFQAGTLFIDGRSCDLCVLVNDMGRHAAMAGLSGTYLVYADCTRQGSSEKMTIVAAVTAGEAGGMMVGRNGIFYDRAGNDWDATVVKLVENAISVREAFWSPYRRISRMISDQLQKLAADKAKAIESKAGEHVVAGTTKVQEAAAAPKDAPKAAPAPFDVARFAGIFAALGLAVGAIGTALASVITGFLGLVWWQMPIAIAGLLLLISGPSMVMAWFKLRQRNLAPILDANGWAVNTRAKLNIRFGTTLTALAALPPGAERSLKDPYA